MQRPVKTSIAIPALFDAAWMLAFLRVRQVPAIEAIDPTSITRALRLDGRAAIVRMTVGASRIQAECSVPLAPAAVRQIVRQMFDLDADVTAFHQTVRRDRLLRPLVRARPGLRVPQFLDLFECVVRAVMGQQVSVRGAATLVDRFVRAYAPRTSDELACFPQPEDVARTTPTRLQTIGLTRARAAALHDLATTIAEGRVDLSALRSAPGTDAQCALEALPGIGPWTASYVRMRGLGDRDAFPAADLGVLKALRAASRDAWLDAAEAERRSERWRPWRAYAVMHLWSSLGRLKPAPTSEGERLKPAPTSEGERPGKAIGPPR